VEIDIYLSVNLQSLLVKYNLLILLELYFISSYIFTDKFFLVLSVSYPSPHTPYPYLLSLSKKKRIFFLFI
jgi:hypothetical protein